MPKYMILASTSVTYMAVVEAPNKDAASAWYRQSDGSEFTRVEEYGGWDLDHIDRLDDDDERSADVTVDKDGSYICEGEEG